MEEGPLRALSCWICNENLAFKHPIKITKTKPSIKKLPIGMSSKESQGLCRVLNIPPSLFRDRIIKFPSCPNCSSKINRILQIVAVLEKLQNTVKVFRNEFADILRKSLEEEENSPGIEIDGTAEDSPRMEDDDANPEKKPAQNDLEEMENLRKEIADLLNQWRANHCKGKSAPSTDHLNPDLVISQLKQEEIGKHVRKFANFTKIKSEAAVKSDDEIGESEIVIKSVESLEGVSPPELPSVDNNENYAECLTNSTRSSSRRNIRSSVKFKDYFLEANVYQHKNIKNSDDDDNSPVRKKPRKLPEIIERKNVKKEEEAEEEDHNSDDGESDNDICSIIKPTRRVDSRVKHPGSKPKKCQKCKASFQTDFDRDVHYKKVHLGVKMAFVCTYENCDRSFRQRSCWKMHVGSHEGGVAERVKKYSCDICNNVYETNNSLQGHISTHTGKWRYPCPEGECSRGFHRPRDLRQHLSRDHDNNDGDYPCDFCPLKFLTLRLRHAHNALQHPEQQLKVDLKCEFCERIFSSRDALRCHKIQLHTGQFRFHCEVCNKGFAKKSWMTRHAISHSDVKGYSCPLCPETFRFPNSLAAHKLRHQNKFKFQCYQCDKKFILRTQLNIHMATHSTDKPFICEYCGKTFNLKVYLSVHLRRIHFLQLGLSEKPKCFETANQIKKDPLGPDLPAPKRPKGRPKLPPTVPLRLNSSEEVVEEEVISEVETQAMEIIFQDENMELPQFQENREIIVEIQPTQNVATSPQTLPISTIKGRKKSKGLKSSRNLTQKKTCEITELKDEIMIEEAPSEEEVIEEGIIYELEGGNGEKVEVVYQQQVKLEGQEGRIVGGDDALLRQVRVLDLQEIHIQQQCENDRDEGQGQFIQFVLRSQEHQ